MMSYDHSSYIHFKGSVVSFGFSRVTVSESVETMLGPYSSLALTRVDKPYSS